MIWWIAGGIAVLALLILIFVALRLMSDLPKLRHALARLQQRQKGVVRVQDRAMKVQVRAMELQEQLAQVKRSLPTRAGGAATD